MPLHPLLRAALFCASFDKITALSKSQVTWPQRQEILRNSGRRAESAALLCAPMRRMIVVTALRAAGCRAVQWPGNSGA